jgi:hypothetical protein
MSKHIREEHRLAARPPSTAGENEHPCQGDERRQRLDAIVGALWGSELLLEWTEHRRDGRLWRFSHRLPEPRDYRLPQRGRGRAVGDYS